MTTSPRNPAFAPLLVASELLQEGAVELKVSRGALERAPRARIFNALGGRNYLKGDAMAVKMDGDIGVN
jgi:hypothetical protein